jgi:hypothetical protein
MRRAMLLAFLLAALTSRAEAIRIEQYVASLQHLDQLLATNQRALAQTEATTLAAYEVDSAIGRFHADESLLAAMADSREAVPQLRARIALTLEELRRATGVGAGAADPRLLAEVTKAQEVEELEAGGEIAGPPAVEVPLIERLLNSVEKILTWLRDKLREFFRWLIGLLPDRGNVAGETGRMRAIVIGVALLILFLLVLLAFKVLRRSKAAEKLVTESSEPIGSERDADPLSRGANEWERYALKLGSEGRYREAIRAWFHAVLVTCYSEGILHFRKGRTNWEYIAALSPSHGWRPELIALTRRFELEWYGHDDSTIEAYEECGGRAQRILDAMHRGGAAA